MRKARIAACAAAVGVGAGIVTGTGVASADIEPDPGGDTSAVGAVVKTATEGASATAKGVLNDIEFIKRVDAASPGLDLAVKRIATNHNLTTARLV
jgi:hypothetical protein